MSTWIIDGPYGDCFWSRSRSPFKSVTLIWPPYRTSLSADPPGSTLHSVRQETNRFYMNLSHGKLTFYCGGGGGFIRESLEGGRGERATQVEDVDPPHRRWKWSISRITLTQVSASAQVEVVGAQEDEKLDRRFEHKSSGKWVFHSFGRQAGVEEWEIDRDFLESFLFCFRTLKLKFGAIELHLKNKLIQYFSNIK